MLQKPNTVFVGKKVNLSGATPAIGDVWVANALTGAAINLSTDALTVSNPDAIKIGFKKNNGAIVYSAPIAKNSIKNLISSGDVDNDPKVEAQVDLDWTAAAIVAGKRYVVRVIYRDIYEHPGQFTHTYEVIATTADVAAASAAKDSIINKFVSKINAHTGRRVTASKQATDVLRLIALPIDGPEAGIATKEAITPYSQVQMKVVAYMTDPSSLLGSNYEAITGIIIANTESKPGKGNPFVVRDREQAALGYKGITYRTEWPVIKPELNVDLTATYDYMVAEFSQAYQSPDNQYVKSTDLALEVYIVNDATASAINLYDKIAAWKA